VGKTALKNIQHVLSPGELGGPSKGEPAGNEATPSEQRVDVESPQKVRDD
jgi:hypothetical protein